VLTSTLYLPLVLGNGAPNVFGVQMGAVYPGIKLDRLTGTESNWVRSAGVPWSAVEAVEGVYNWSAIAAQEAQFINAANQNLTIMVIVSNTPSWAQMYPGVYCGPIKSNKLAAFGNFMQAMVQRYSKAPYNVHNWEIWNEPDVDYRLVQPNSAFGCWGNANDTYYGGGYFADMLKAIYPKIKSADPQAKVISGGLLLNCDPNQPAICSDTRPGRFFEGILRNGGAAAFDGVGFHGYDAYITDGGHTIGHYYMPNWGTSWNNTTGPYTAMIAKANFLRGVMNAYGVTGKFLVNNESAVGSFEPTLTADFETTKSYYVAQAYATARSLNLHANIWYGLDDDWNWQALIDPVTGAPRPSYYAYQFAASMLSRAAYIGPVTGFANVRGYEFRRDGHTLWLLWAQDDSQHVVPLPSVPLAAYHVNGSALAVGSAQVTIGYEPIYLEWGP
jgi:hypothetical protein